ncbi:MAG: DUF2200 domain-containing protein [Pirellulales bacterium]
MKRTVSHDERVAKLVFAAVYPHLLAKVEKKGRTREELHQVITWLTGYSEKELQALLESRATYEQFFQQARLNPHADLIKGVICGYRIEEIENRLTRQARYLDKLVDELAQGRPMEKVLRSPAAKAPVTKAPAAKTAATKTATAKSPTTKASRPTRTRRKKS